MTRMMRCTSTTYGSSFMSSFYLCICQCLSRHVSTCGSQSILLVHACVQSESHVLPCDVEDPRACVSLRGCEITIWMGTTFPSRAFPPCLVLARLLQICGKEHLDECF